jgi:type VI protein secretion system component VasK
MNSQKKGSALTIIKGGEKRISKRTRFILFAVVVIIAVVGAGIVATTYRSNKSYANVYKNAVKALDENNYKKANSLLNSVKDNTEAKSSYKFYTQRARAAYGLNDKKAAKTYATTGVDLYKKAKDKESSFGIILNDISSETFIPEALKNEQYKVPEKQLEQQGFQG